MLSKLIDVGLTVMNVVSLVNNNTRDERKPTERQKQREVNKQISNLRNAAYILRRLTK